MGNIISAKRKIPELLIRKSGILFLIDSNIYFA